MEQIDRHQRTAGRQLLLVVLQRCGGREVARRCGVAPSRVSEWGSGLTRPSTLARDLLQRMYGIPVDAWCSQPARIAAPLTFR